MVSDSLQEIEITVSKIKENTVDAQLFKGGLGPGLSLGKVEIGLVELGGSGDLVAAGSCNTKAYL